jgi:hypothetical protein
MQRTPAGLPFGMPGMALVIDGAVQQAPQCGRQIIEVVRNEVVGLVRRSPRRQVGPRQEEGTAGNLKL